MKVLRITYWFICGAFLANVLAYYNYGISLPGYASDIVLFWMWLCLTVVVIVLNFKRSWAKVYSAFLVAFVILTMLPMMIPFIHIVSFAFGGNRHYHNKFDSKYRIEEINGFGLVRRRLHLVEKRGVYEKIIGDIESNLDEYSEPSTELIKKTSSNKFSVKFTYKDTVILNDF
ncbi:MAG: hypothetical protein ACK514_01970 [Bacteroidota bacterium]|jgi:hypothetical protein|nr:hypothetical protein [Cytophagales bacterium]MCE2957241.1 hypothetical protein [Flammeovirgaceae bacterium]MCZ8071935.1 hypothetical protein [Cytophagales bacterium]